MSDEHAGRDRAAAGPRHPVRLGRSREIRAAVERELSHDPLVDATGITVENVDGDVALEGAVPSYPQYVNAAAAARRVAGVSEVHNHLKVVLPLDDVRDDAMLTTAANHALAASATVPPGVEAVAKDGNLTLTGLVQYATVRAAAEKAVSGLIGVRGIRNKIDVTFDVDPADVKQLVTEALERSGVNPGNSDVAVDRSGSTVTLFGHVRTRAERDAVVGAAWTGHGVETVLDELEITGLRNARGSRIEWVPAQKGSAFPALLRVGDHSESVITVRTSHGHRVRVERS